MFPILHDGDVIQIEKISYKNVKVNDILFFKSRNRLLTHRVIYKKKYTLITKGDSNPISDGKLSPKNILGRVVTTQRYGQEIDIDDMYLFQSTIYFNEISRIVSLFNAQSIDFVILKGLPVHLFFEKKHPRRIYADCDVLIRRKDIEKARGILLENKFVVKKVELSSIHKILKDKVVEETFIKKLSGFPFVLDIHYEPAFLLTQIGSLENIYPQRLLDQMSNQLLSSKRGVLIENTRVPLLCLEDQILYLLLHLFHHNFRGAYRYDLLAELMKSRFDEKSLAHTINKFKIQNFVYPTLLLMEKYYKQNSGKKIINLLQVNEATRKYMKKTVATLSIFDEDTRVEGGVQRFMLLYRLSFFPQWRKILTFFNIQVLYSILYVLIIKLTKNIQHKSFL